MNDLAEFQNLLSVMSICVSIIIFIISCTGGSSPIEVQQNKAKITKLLATILIFFLILVIWLGSPIVKLVTFFVFVVAFSIYYVTTKDKKRIDTVMLCILWCFVSLSVSLHILFYFIEMLIDLIEHVAKSDSDKAQQLIDLYDKLTELQK